MMKHNVIGKRQDYLREQVHRQGQKKKYSLP